VAALGTDAVGSRCIARLENTAYPKSEDRPNAQNHSLTDYNSPLGGIHAGEDVFLETIYSSLAGQKNGLFVKHN
jgi:hypothetical protein